jgi:hypothetical protein
MKEDNPQVAPATKTMKQMAQAYGVCLATTYNWHYRGWLPTVKIGGIRRVTPAGEAVFLDRAERGECVIQNTPSKS